ncbi:hypothetical protein [Porphyromonas levii]|uniref:TapB family protein n=1 Tax=Porphyromonas levii TaxID=28114 RepID=UPI00035E01E2|nr:hypothetical protein [Porphyromonas levii]
MRKFIYAIMGLFISLASSAQAFLPTDPIGTTLQYEVTKRDTVTNSYYVLKGLKKSPQGLWMEVEIEGSLKDKKGERVVLKILHKPNALAMDIGRLITDAIEMDKEAAEKLQASAKGELLSIPLQNTNDKLPLEKSKIYIKVSRIITVSINMGWKEKAIVGRETLDLPIGKYETFVMKGRVHVDFGIGILRKGIDINYTFWIAPGVGVVKYERKAMDSKETCRLVKKILPQS